jgi:hypothetical protein
MAKAKRQRRIAESEDGDFKTLRLRNIGADTSPRDLLELFPGEHYHIADLSVQLIVPENSKLTEGFIALPKHEAAYAKEWALGRLWRGQKLDAALPGDETW